MSEICNRTRSNDPAHEVVSDPEPDREARLERALRTLFEHLASLGPACT
jgi:hypothetical protein